MTSRLVFEKLYTISMRPEQIYLLSSVALDQLEWVLLANELKTKLNREL